MLAYTGHEEVELTVLVEESYDILRVNLTAAIHVTGYVAAHLSEFFQRPLIVANQLIGAFQIVGSSQCLVEIQSTGAAVVDGGHITGGVEHTVAHVQLGVGVLVPPLVGQIDRGDFLHVQQVAAQGDLPGAEPGAQQDIVLVQTTGYGFGHISGGVLGTGVFDTEIVLGHAVLNTLVNRSFKGVGGFCFCPDIHYFVVTGSILFVHTDDTEIGTAEVGLIQDQTGIFRGLGVGCLIGNGVGSGGVRRIRGVLVARGEQRNQHQGRQKNCKNFLHK